jgi:hypothetical protein
MKGNTPLLNSLLQAGCTPTTPVGEALTKVSRHYGYASPEFQSFLAFVRANSPDSLPAKYWINKHVVVKVGQAAKISGPLSPSAVKPKPAIDWQPLIDWLSANINLSNIIPSRFTRLSDMVPQ